MRKLRLPVVHPGRFARRSLSGTPWFPYDSLVDLTGSRVSTPGLLSQPAALDDRRFVSGRQQALPSSRATPMSTCPVLRPRWCPLLLAIPYEGTAAFRSLKDVGFPSRTSEVILFDHDYTDFGVQSHGLHSCYTRLHTFRYRNARGFATDLSATLWSGRTCLAAHRLGNVNEFHPP